MQNTAIASSIDEFAKRFNFLRDRTLHIGVEREMFLTLNGTIVPHAHKALGLLHSASDPHGQVSYELSACQIEGHVGPCGLHKVREELADLENMLSLGLKDCGLEHSYAEVAPKTMPLDIFPDPTGRYQQITKEMPREILLAACRIIGTHVHIGMPDHETALRVYNAVIHRTEELCRLGDHSEGERLRIYRMVKPDCMPLSYASWDEFYRDAVAKGFAGNLRNNWSLVRLTKHGTIEFRTFGATGSIDEVCSWVEMCHRLCAEALR